MNNLNNSLQSANNRIESKFNALAKENQKALITYISAGDPDLATTEELIYSMEKAGADIIELGIPYSDPLADGPVIQQAAQRALAAGATIEKIFDLVEKVRTKSQIPLIFMTYYNPILQYGLEKFVAKAQAVGVDGFIVPDLPVEESSPLQKQCDEANVVLIPLVAPTTPESRLPKVMAKARGFIYCVSLTGVTGARENIGTDIAGFMQRVKEATQVPVAIGFGISNPEQAGNMAQFSEGVIVGSAIIKIIAENLDNKNGIIEKVSRFVSELKSGIRR
jgi:tryptophan synthase alpha chain